MLIDEACDIETNNTKKYIQYMNEGKCNENCCT